MKRRGYPIPDTLVMLLKQRRDLTYLKDEGWYRIPLKSAPKTLQDVEYLAFYQPKDFGEDSWRVQYYGRKGRTMQVKRIELLPREVADRQRYALYYRVEVEDLQQTSQF